MLSSIVNVTSTTAIMNETMLYTNEMTKRNGLFLSIIIPAYNEAQRISATLYTVDKFMRTKDVSYEILVVNDGSKDETSLVVEELTLKIPHLRLIDNKENHGKGWVIQQGMLEAQGEYRLFMDADGSTSIEYVDQLLAAAHEGYDVVISSRRIKGAIIDVPQGKMREMLGTLFRSLVHFLVPLGIVDSQNGFKLFSKKAAEIIFTKQKTGGLAFDVEILAIARLYGFSIKEEPIRWIDDNRSTVTKRKMIQMLSDIFKIKLNLMNGKYGHYHPQFGDQRLITLSKFLLFGLANTIVDWLWYLALTRTFDFFADHLVFAKGVAFLIGSIPIFLGNAYWVFPKGIPVTIADHIKLYGILGAAFFINTAALTAFLVYGFNDVLSLILATGVSFIWNIGMSWFLLFKDRIGIPVYTTA
jgi:dolichyl-phosphate beta-glucosyltransferase